jgi:hypothetical protein
MTRPLRIRAAALGLAATLVALSACTDSAPPSGGFRDAGVPAGGFALVAFDSCEDALGGLRAAAKEVVGPYGFFTSGVLTARGGDMRAQADAAGAPPPVAGPGAAEAEAAPGVAPRYSGTNTHEAGVDEPDLVKTDGRRIVTTTGGVLRVVDPATQAVTGKLNLAPDTGPEFGYQATDLLLAGDHALVLVRDSVMAYRATDLAGRPGPGGAAGPRLVLVDLAGAPRVLSTMEVEGSLLDARQVGSTARVVVRSAPRIDFPTLNEANVKERTRVYREAIDRTPLERWLPRITTSAEGVTRPAAVGCDAISRPSVYSGTSLLTILTVDIAAPQLGDGQPVTLVADGETVYSNGPSLYIAADQRWRTMDMRADVLPAPDKAKTEVYKFDTSGPGKPRYVAGGSVPGSLINQYAMSEWEGHLRVATTVEGTFNRDGRPDKPSSSGVYVLRPDGRTLRELGKVTGLGKTERIFAVRFVGPVGYVVTFRQTDPLYTLDLRNPQRPVLKGELKIPGYSAYLHPIDGNRLIGIGQDADAQGRVRGTQVSLFDVADISQPTRVATYTLPGAYSQAEFDPHAFLWWPADRLLVVPLVHQGGQRIAPDGNPAGVALVLRVDGATIREVGELNHPAADSGPVNVAGGQILRSLVVGDTLWTVSDAGLMANRIPDLTPRGFVRY